MILVCLSYVHSLVDDTRVHLDLIPGIEGSDYINGNYIDVRKNNLFIVITMLVL